MKIRISLIIDAVIDFILAVILLAYSPRLVEFLGIPPTDNYFYPNILGAILLGISIALVIEAFRKGERSVGLGAVGAASITLCGALVLLFWLLFGHLNLPMKGFILLWILDGFLLLDSSFELVMILGLRKSG